MKKRTEITVERRTVTVVRRGGVSLGRPCATCGRPDVMLPVQDAATIVGLSTRIVCRAVEQGAIDFEEQADGVLWVCVDSLLRLHSQEPESP